MSALVEKAFEALCSLSQKFRSVEQQVRKGEVSPSQRTALHNQLETLHRSLDVVREEASRAGERATSFFRELNSLEQEFVSLYREIDNRFDEYEIALISKEALQLGSSLSGTKAAQVSLLVDSLSANIHYLFAHRRPSMQQRKVVHLAMKIVDYAKQSLSHVCPKLIAKGKLARILHTLLQEALRTMEQPIGLSEAQLAMDLYEIAELLYEGKKSKARELLSFVKEQLTRAQICRVESADDEDELIQALLEIADGDPCLEFQPAPEGKNILKFGSTQ